MNKEKEEKYEKLLKSLNKPNTTLTIIKNRITIKVYKGNRESIKVSIIELKNKEEALNTYNFIINLAKELNREVKFWEDFNAEIKDFDAIQKMQTTKEIKFKKPVKVKVKAAKQ